MVDQISEELAVSERGDEVATVELSLLLEAVVRWAGYDFRDYAPATLKRRIAERMRAEGVETISGLQERVLHDPESLRNFVFAMSASSNRLFRPPEYMRAFRSRVVPLLRTYSFVRLWFPACSTGEDVYSVAAALLEADLLDRCMIYATDLSDLALAQAREGQYDIPSFEDFANDYTMGGGELPLSQICARENSGVRFNDVLKKNVIFAQHSLATDASLNEFHAIVARGVFPQFSKSLQYRVHNLFLQSLARLGFLCVGSAESLHATPHEGAFRKIDDVVPIYRRMR
ncbi:MAG TPA: CheR family methyltransferase [Candidatus Baltobacteraceae bacterium]|jgi:chemotaxis protein methyltransferase CheR